MRKTVLITLKTFNNRYEMLAMKKELEAEGIKCYTKTKRKTSSIGTENIVQLQIREGDFRAATKILRETSYESVNATQTKTDYSSRLERLTAKIPRFSNLPYPVRKQVVSIFFVVAALISLIVFILPSSQKKLTSNLWCVDHVNYNGTNYYPYTLGLRVEVSGFCNNDLLFYKDNKTLLPGFNSNSVIGTWSYTNGKVCIAVDTLKQFYDGCFEVDFLSNNSKLILSNAHTQIHCYKQHN